MLIASLGAIGTAYAALRAYRFVVAIIGIFTYKKYPPPVKITLTEFALPPVTKRRLSKIY